MTKKRVILLALLLLPGCTDESGAREALEAYGMSDIEITGYGGPFACSRDDTSTTGFRARNPQGRRVDGVVCCGLIFKNCTVRF